MADPARLAVVPDPVVGIRFAFGQILDAGKDRRQAHPGAIFRGDDQAVQPHPAQSGHLRQRGIEGQTVQGMSGMSAVPPISQEPGQGIIDPAQIAVSFHHHSHAGHAGRAVDAVRIHFHRNHNRVIIEHCLILEDPAPGQFGVAPGLLQFQAGQGCHQGSRAIP